MERERLLIKGLKELGIEPSDEIINRFDNYLFELKKWNRAYNLTALKNDEDIIIKHFFDSLLYLRVVPEGQRDICDIGSGAGFPGVPMAIVNTRLNITLIEPSRKKVAFLRHMKKALMLNNIEVLDKRIEDVRNMLFDIAVTRALFNIKDLIKEAGHILKEDGFFVLNKGPRFEDEIIGLPDNVKFEVITITLPCTSLQRYLIVLKFA
ncbi:16S rRNA (guanine(527)-N(7))-methyltransferase RsmG [hot springs metagenome]|uniref:16S rRNA (Guanine(527)-N(7))-methyltransferase RsmG n=1 Tax=hot springs metagenome TaxID=433727 RepID=A0A5J4KZE0_9ZZZZ